MSDTLTLRNDYLFKLLLGAEENKACLQDFLECVLDMPVLAMTSVLHLKQSCVKIIPAQLLF